MQRYGLTSLVLGTVVRRSARAASVSTLCCTALSPLTAALSMVPEHVPLSHAPRLHVSLCLSSRLCARVNCTPRNPLWILARHFCNEGSGHPNRALASESAASVLVGDDGVKGDGIMHATGGMSGVCVPARRKTEEEATASATTAAAEEEELRKDQKALQQGILGVGFAVLCVLAVIYGSRRARKRYFGEEGSARVSVESRGRPALGGPFVLVNTNGEPVSQAEFLGSWTFFYFGFTHCPEICPVELNRMTHVVNTIHEKRPAEKVVPLFVSCDPRRDSLEAIDEYLSVFHPDFVGLVGTPKQVNDACKSYRIYYSVPSEEDAMTEDYLIDHSIAIFLFDPRGRFVDFFGNRYNEHEIADKILYYMQQYENDPTWTNW